MNIRTLIIATFILFMNFKCTSEKSQELKGIWEFDDYLLWCFDEEIAYYQHLMPAGNYLVKGDTLFIKDVYPDLIEEEYRETLGSSCNSCLKFLITAYSSEKISLLPINESWMQIDKKKEYVLKKIHLSEHPRMINIDLKIRDRENYRLAYEITGSFKTGFEIFDNRRNKRQKINFKNPDTIQNLTNNVFENDNNIALSPNEIVGEYYFNLDINNETHRKTYNFNFHYDISNRLRLLITLLMFDNDYRYIQLN